MTGREGAPSTDRLAEAHAQLLAAVDRLVDGPAWRQMLDVAARFHRYSANNVLLISVQRPDATQVAGYQTWRELGRQVRKGETGIAILAPVTVRRRDSDADAAPRPIEEVPATQAPKVLRGFRVTHVFDVSQTDGPPLPEVRPAQLDGGAPLGLWADLLDQIEAEGYDFNWVDVSPANGRTDFGAQTVVLRPDLTGAQAVKTLAHELAHVRLHHPHELPAGFTRARAEVEAESVAYIVCSAHGLATGDYTVPYVAGWADGDRDLIRDTSTRVLTTARGILTVASPGPDGTVSVPVVSAERTAAAMRELQRMEPVPTRDLGRAG